MDGQMDGMNGQMDGMNGQMHEMDEWMGWMGWMDSQMDRRVGGMDRVGSREVDR